MATRWEPVGDGEYDCQHEGDSIVVDRDYLKVSELNIMDRYEAEVALVEDLRICRRVEAPAIPPEVATIIKTALEELKSLRGDEWYGCNEECDAALAWLEQETGQ